MIIKIVIIFIVFIMREIEYFFEQILYNIKITMQNYYKIVNIIVSGFRINNNTVLNILEDKINLVKKSNKLEFHKKIIKY